MFKNNFNYLFIELFDNNYDEKYEKKKKEAPRMFAKLRLNILEHTM